MIHFYSSEFLYSDCGTNPPNEYYINKIYIINLDNFEIIHRFESFAGEANIVILKKYICIINYENFYYNIINIYDKNNYKLLNKIQDGIDKSYIIKFNENMIIAISKNERINYIILYDLSDFKNIKYIFFKENFIKFIISRYNFTFTINGTKNKSIIKSKNGSILIICLGFIYIIELPRLNLISFNNVKYYESKQRETIDYLYKNNL